MDFTLRNLLNAISESALPSAIVMGFGTALALTVLVAVVQQGYSWLDASPPKGIASIDVWKLGMVTGTVGTATAFLVTLFVAQRQYQRSREHIPHLSMNLAIERMPVSQSFDVVILTLTAKNTGSGLCRVERIDWEINVLSPYDDDTVRIMDEEFMKGIPGAVETDAFSFPWHRYKRAITAFDLNIEPNETEETTQDFIVEAFIEGIVASAWVANASDPKLTEGWYRRKAHSLDQEE